MSNTRQQQAGTTNSPIQGIPAALSTKTSMLFGLWASAGQDDFNNELSALQQTIDTYCNSGLSDLVAGIAVGSEDLYRVSPTGVENDSGAGASPDQLVSYVGQVRTTLKGSCLSSASIGHVDTWTAWVNGSNAAVISAIDWLGVDAYPYFQNTQANAIDNGQSLFQSALDATRGVAGGRDVWVTETGWPVSGSTSGSAVPSLQNARTYWKEVACALLGNTNTWWFTLQDAAPTTPNPSFGIIGSSLTETPLYDLSCSGSTGGSGGSSSSSSSSSPKSSSAPAKTSTPATSTAGSGSGSGSGSTSSPSSDSSSAPSSTPSSTPSSAPGSSAASSGSETTYPSTYMRPTNSLLPPVNSTVPFSTGGMTVTTASAGASTSTSASSSSVTASVASSSQLDSFIAAVVALLMAVAML